MPVESIFISKGSNLNLIISLQKYHKLKKNLIFNSDNFISRIRLNLFRFGLLMVRDINLETFKSSLTTFIGINNDLECVESDINFPHVATDDGKIYQIPDCNSWANSVRIISGFASKQPVLSFPVFNRNEMNDLQEIGCVNILNRATFDETLNACQLGILNCAVNNFYSPLCVTNDVLPPCNNWNLLFRYFKNRTLFKARARLSINNRRPNWVVGYRSIGESDIRVIPTANIKEFIADPFILTRNNKNYIFCEKMNAENGLGQISVLEVNDSDTASARQILDEEFHMSFPFIFEFESRIFMVPESSSTNSIRIYECVDFPYQWKFSSQAISDIRAADPMIFKHDGLWWLLCNTDYTEVNSFCLELSIFYSNNPLSGEWLAHPKNPVIDGSTIARNAGLIEEAGKIVRLAQRQGFLEYGAGLETLEILKLTGEQYEEAQVHDAKIDELKQVISGHHYDRNSTLEVFDIKYFH